MERRRFLSLLGATTAALPLGARAQQSPTPVVGYLYGGSAELSAHLVAGFRKGLAEGGYVEGRNVAIEYRWAHNDNAMLPELAADLVRRRVSVIAAIGGTTALAAKAATQTIPIVFRTGGEP